MSAPSGARGVVHCRADCLCQSLPRDFHYDDSLTILENQHLSDWHTFISHLDHMVRPVLYASFLVDRLLYGFEPAGYHALNILPARRFNDSRLRDPQDGRGRRRNDSLWTALIFAIHPIATETVTYISGRASGLMAFFYLFALFLYVRAWDVPASRRPVSRWAALGLWILSIGSKETAVTLPLILPLGDALVFGESKVLPFAAPCWPRLSRFGSFCSSRRMGP